MLPKLTWSAFSPVLIPLTLLLCGGSTEASAPITARAGSFAGQPSSGTASTQDCLECHDDKGSYQHLGAHTSLLTEGLASKAGTDNACMACHGDANEHAQNGGDGPVFAFGDSDPWLEKSNQCLGCHGQTHPRFLVSSHAMAGLDCTSCHRGNEGGPSTVDELVSAAPEGYLGRSSELCTGCHAGPVSEFTFNVHHRLEEGILECTSCHDPHEPPQAMLLGGFKQQQCVNCHVDKGGPFVFEHGSSLVEGCTSCHVPHGSPNRHMLLFQSVADQCYSCHVQVPGFHSRFTSETLCTNCHSSIHGSNLHPAFLQ